MSQNTNKDLPNLLRALASSDSARERGHDIILHAAADELDAAWGNFDALSDALKTAVGSTLHRALYEGKVMPTPRFRGVVVFV